MSVLQLYYNGRITRGVTVSREQRKVGRQTVGRGYRRNDLEYVPSKKRSKAAAAFGDEGDDSHKKKKTKSAIEMEAFKQKMRKVGPKGGRSGSKSNVSDFVDSTST